LNRFRCRTGCAWLVQNCCFVGRDNCGRAIGILRETNGRWVEFEETTILLNAWGRRPWPAMYFGDRPRDTQAVPLDLRSQRAQIPESFVHVFLK
jgi:hypothetical protein